MNFRIIFKILGILSLIIGVAMVSCLIYAILENCDISKKSLSLSGSISIFIGTVFYIVGYKCNNEILRKESIIIVGLTWIEVSLLGSLPYLFYINEFNFIDSLFESISGFTTTGATIINDIESLPKPLLLWRSITQWLGGIGILVVFISVLSFLGVGNRSLFQQESSLNISDSGAAKIRDVALNLLIVYSSLTLLCFLGLNVLGMTVFDSLCHAMTTIATGGFSTKNLSIGYYDDHLIEFLIIIFMLLSSISFLLYIFIINKKWHRIKSEEEAKYYFLIIILFTLIVSLNIISSSIDNSFKDVFRNSLFNVVSISSTTGFTLSDYDKWPLSSKILLLILMIIGGCAGSTSGGIKMNRIILFIKIYHRELIRSFRPSKVFKIKLNGSSPNEQVFATTSFFLALSFLCSIISCLVISFFEPTMNFLSVVGAVSATIFNIGPGFESVGPTDNFASLHYVTKSILSFLMILGRIEYFSLLVLFVPSLWKKY